MGNKIIVRRTFEVCDGEKSNKVHYLMYPPDANGSETWTTNIDNAYLFEQDNIYQFSNYTKSGVNRGGGYKYKQKILKAKDVFK